MKKNNVLLTWTAAFLLVAALSALTFAQGGGFTSPKKGDTIEDPKNFKVFLQIKDFNKSDHYWVAIATVKGHQSTWRRVLELYENNRNGDRAAREEMKKLIGKWQIDKFWPKLYVRKSPSEYNVHDFGENPLPEPRPMILVILKIDDSGNEVLKNWFHDAPDKGYPGIMLSDLPGGIVFARCEIFFPYDD